MIKVYDFRAEHITRLRAQDAQQGGEPMTFNYGRTLERVGPAISCITDSGDVVMCAGYGELWAGRHVAWAVLSQSACKHMLRLTRIVKAMLGTPTGRVEAIVEYDFEQGHRWVRMLGFDVEIPKAVKYLPGGVDASVYVRFN